MMNTTHRSVSAGVAAIEVSLLPAPWPVKLSLFALGWYAGAAPDFDSKNSSPSRELWVISGFVSAMVRAASWVVQSATGDGAKAGEPNGVHRKFSHTIEGCALAGVLVWFAVDQLPVVDQWAVWFGLVFATCAWSHSLLGDLFTKHGVPLSLIANALVGDPWRDNHPPQWLPRAKTNKPSEHLVFMAVVRVFVVAAVVFAVRFPFSPPVPLVVVILGLGWHLWAVMGMSRKRRSVMA